MTVLLYREAGTDESVLIMRFLLSFGRMRAKL